MISHTLHLIFLLFCRFQLPFINNLFVIFVATWQYRQNFHKVLVVKFNEMFKTELFKNSIEIIKWNYQEYWIYIHCAMPNNWMNFLIHTFPPSRIKEVTRTHSQVQVFYFPWPWYWITSNYWKNDLRNLVSTAFPTFFELKRKVSKFFKKQMEKTSLEEKECTHQFLEILYEFELFRRITK